MTDSLCHPDRLCAMAQTRFEEMDKRWDVRYEALRRSIDKSEELLTVRLNEMNNFRKQIQQERQDFITRRETVMINFVISIVIVLIGAFVSYLLIR